MERHLTETRYEKDRRMAAKGLTYRVDARICRHDGLTVHETWYLAGAVTSARIRARIAALGGREGSDFDVERIGAGRRREPAPPWVR